MIEMAVTEASLRLLLRNLSHLYVPFADAKDGLCGFDYLIKNKNPDKKSEFLFLVEMARVELASENLFLKLSTSVVYLLKFPIKKAERQASFIGSPALCDGLQGGVPVHIYC